MLYVIMTDGSRAPEIRISNRPKGLRDRETGESAASMPALVPSWTSPFAVGSRRAPLFVVAMR